MHTPMSAVCSLQSAFYTDRAELELADVQLVIKHRIKLDHATGQNINSIDGTFDCARLFTS